MTALATGDRGVDFSYARPDVKAAVTPQPTGPGGKFFIRYSAGAASNPNHPSHALNAGKLCSKVELTAILATGADFIANSEWYESRMTEGAKAGAEDGAADLAFWRGVGLARGASVYCSWDQYADPAKFPAVDAYLDAHNHAMAGYYHSDCYAGTQYLRHALSKGLIRFGWRPNAGAWSGDSLPYQPATVTPAQRSSLVHLAGLHTPAHIWQTGNYWFGKSADENLIVKTPVGSHREQLAVPTPTPPPKPPTPNVPPVTPTPTPTPTPTHGVFHDTTGHYTLTVDPDGVINAYHDGKWVKAFR